MINIRPVSDLRNKFPSEALQVPTLLLKMVGTMVLMGIEQYSALTDDVEEAR